ncbi:MAG: DNA cytosine methyltransferase [Candidatus Aegiribacteria sp.]|nr:DNA cytosine methyltransferase [Candidatus Aegiribacteria sp.]
MQGSEGEMLVKPIAVDMYCGCGAVTEGLKTSFRVVAAIDNDPTAAASYRANHPNVKFFEKDIRELSPTAIRKVVGDRNIDLLVVCAPCQPFSSQNSRKGEDDRVSLVLQASRFAAVLKPRLIFFENVSGLLAPRHSELLRELRIKLQSLGFSEWCGPIRVNAADYGVPQRRYRCVMMVARKRVNLPHIPPASTPENSRVTVREAIGDLASLSSGEASSVDGLHFARKHRSIALQRFRHIAKDGGSRFDLPLELELECHKHHRGHPDVYGRMSWNEVAPTLTSGCTDATRGRFVHPEDDRAITLREAARLQTFPDHYIFEGNPQDIATQIGNAVPVDFVRVFGKTMCVSLRTGS